MPSALRQRNDDSPGHLYAVAIKDAADPAQSPHHFCRIFTWHRCGLVLGSALETRGRPVHGLNAVHAIARRVLTVARARFDLHELRHEDRHGDFGHRQLLVVGPQPQGMDLLECFLRVKLSWLQVSEPQTPRTCQTISKIEPSSRMVLSSHSSMPHRADSALKSSCTR